MGIENAIASVAVTELESSVSWYSALFGRGADSSPMPELAEWRFPRGGWLQVYAAPDRAGNGSFTLSVSDLDEVVAHVAGLGIDTSRQTSGPVVKTLMIADPDGNSIAFAESADGSRAH